MVMSQYVCISTLDRFCTLCYFEQETLSLITVSYVKYWVSQLCYLTENKLLTTYLILGGFLAF